jgi:hypothetical protein
MPKKTPVFDIHNRKHKEHCEKVFNKIWSFESQRRHYSNEFKLNYYDEHKVTFCQFRPAWEAVRTIAQRFAIWADHKLGPARCYDWYKGKFLGGQNIKNVLSIPQPVEVRDADD